MKFDRILIPVVGTEIDAETINLACRLAKKDRTKILAVYIIPIVRELPLDAEMSAEVKKAEEILASAGEVALKHGFEIETDLLQARNVGPSIIDEAVERKVDLIVMGISYKQRFGQYSLGNVTPYVLKNAACRVILYQQYQSSESSV
ncbi:MAG: universal stress protein [Dehalococcoidales bacterium]|nr:universal stress protein [Dehalococcoidales bacterium]